GCSTSQLGGSSGVFVDMERTSGAMRRQDETGRAHRGAGAALLVQEWLWPRPDEVSTKADMWITLLSIDGQLQRSAPVHPGHHEFGGCSADAFELDPARGRVAVDQLDPDVVAGVDTVCGDTRNDRRIDHLDACTAI